MTLAAPRVAAANAFEGHPSAPRGPIAFNRGDRIGRTARLIAAARRKDARRAQLPAARDQNHEPRDHGLRKLSSAPWSSVHSRPKSRSTPFARPIITWSDPATPLIGTI